MYSFLNLISIIHNNRIPAPGYFTDQEMQRLRQVNEEKRKVAIERLGTKWLLHPQNQTQRKLDNTLRG